MNYNKHIYNENQYADLFTFRRKGVYIFSRVNGNMPTGKMPTRKNAHREKCPQGKMPTRKNAHREKCPQGKMPTRKNAHMYNSFEIVTGMSTFDKNSEKRKGILQKLAILIKMR